MSVILRFGEGYTSDDARGEIVKEIVGEREAQVTDHGYTFAHDDLYGHAHLVSEAHYRLGHMGEVASPLAVRDEIVVAAALLVAAIETIDRLESEAKAKL